MGPEPEITCDHIKKDLKPFLEDLLKEEEYQAFLKHIEGCSECRKYVDSVDSFSNQLRKLADVEVPADFCSTVLFKLKQPEPEPEPESSLGVESSSKSDSDLTIKLLIGGVLLFVAGAGLFLGITYFKQSKSNKIPNMAVPVSTPIIAEKEHNESESGVDQAYELESGISDDGIGFLEIVEEDSAVEDGLSEPQLLHWHFLYYDKSKELEVLRLRSRKRKLESEIKKSVEENQSEDIIKKLADEKDQIEANLDQNLNEARRKEGEPLNIIKKIGIQPDYQDDDFLLFGASEENLKKILDEIALISKEKSSLESFTPGASSGNNKVSVYIERRETFVEHWHVHLSMPGQRAQFLSAINERGGIVTYEFAEEMTFSISESKIADLQAQMPAMRISLSKFGNRKSKEITNEEGEIIAEPVVISVYFPK